VFGKLDDLTFVPTSQELSALVASVDKNIETVLKVRHQLSTVCDDKKRFSLQAMCVKPADLSQLKFSTVYVVACTDNQKTSLQLSFRQHLKECR
jgi:hypothetical protein